MESSSSETPRRSTCAWTSVAIVSVVVGVLELVTWRLGFHSRIPWFLWQLLDRQLLVEDPFESLWLLHAQPPLLNILAATVARTSDATGVGEPVLVGAVLGLAGFTAAVLFLRLAERVTARRWLSISLTIGLLLQPSYWIFRHRLFYPFLLLVLFLLVVWLGCRFLETGRLSWLSATAGSLLLVHSLRSLYPPAFGLVILFGLVLLAFRCRQAPPRRLRVLAIVLLVHLLPSQLWPLKNQILFGQWTHSSWTGHNLSRGLPISKGENIRELRQLFKSDDCKAGCQITAAPPPEVLRLGAPPHLVDVRTSTGGLNGNHYAFLLDGPGLVRDGVAWRIDHPRKYAKLLPRNYAWTVRPPFIHPYGERIDGPDDPRWKKYCQTIAAVFYPSFPIRGPGKRPIELSWFGIILPVLVFAGLWLGAARAWRGEIRGAILLLSCWILIWQTGVVTLTDAQEGNRMRVATLGPFFLVLGAVLDLLFDRGRHLTRRIRSAARPSG